MKSSIIDVPRKPTTVNGKPGDFAKLLDLLRDKLRYKVENC